VERLGVLGSVGGTALVVGDLFGDATLCKLFDDDDDDVELMVVLDAAETSSSSSKDICFRACLSCHDMGNFGPFWFWTHIPFLATVDPAHAPDATAAKATAAKTMCATSVRPAVGMAVAATIIALDPTVSAATLADWAAMY
jgi:hypothetical protein